MDADSRTSQLHNELQHSIEKVSDALKLANDQKRKLLDSAVVAKNQSQDDISFHYELLRNREVWLLDQVDLHVQMKEETLESHFNKLCALLAKLELCQQLLRQPDQENNEILHSQAEEMILRIDSEVLHIEDPSKVCFSADNFALGNAVKSYGNIKVGEPCSSPGQLPGIIKRKRALFSRDCCQDTAFIQEHFKRVARSPQKDWLLDESYAVEERRDFGIVWKYYEELQKSDSKEWLSTQPQAIMDVEAVSYGFNKHFQQVKATPAAEWLQNEDGINPAKFPSYSTIDTSENIKAWLLGPMENLTLTSRGENLVDEESSLSQKYSLAEKDNDWVWQEKLKEQTADPQEITTEKQVPDDWLIGSLTSHPSQLSKTGSWLQRFRESIGTSSSDWLIVSESEALPEYCEWLTQESTERCKSCPGECAKDTLNAFRNVLNSSKSEWLATASDW